MNSGTVRFVRPDDAPALRAIYVPFVTDTPVTFETDPPSVQEMSERIAAVTRMYPWLVYERDGQVVGYAYASRHRARSAYRYGVDVSIYNSPSVHRQGVGRALYDRLFAFLEQQGFYTAYAGITLPNEKSVGFHTAFGFTPVGVYRGVGYKLGQWHDVIWMEKRIRPAQGTPAEPRPITEWTVSRREME